MKVIIDTSSLLALVRYYLPFDNNRTLFGLIQSKIVNKDIIIIDKVIVESKYITKGIILEKLDYLKDREIRINTTEILPTRKFYNQLEHQFVYGSVKNRLNEAEYEKMKESFLQSADAKLILYALEYNKENNMFQDDKMIIVTEESSTENDNKFIKKIPQIGKILELDVITLPEYFIRLGVKIEY
ncbi:DUF4411 family protein [Candidatus Gracilibacteria bacterium]|nr:DUF4411 family protein [Candidatus Gracilibacteria bacterium]